MAVRVWLLGGFRVSVGVRTIPQDAWRLKKAASLVKQLALAPGHRMHREQAMDLLWPDSGRKAASNSLRSTLHTARKVLDAAIGTSYLASEDEWLVLCPEGDLRVDVDTFEEAAASSRGAKEPAAYRAVLDLYEGDLLPEDRYEEWIEGRREELRQLYLALLVEFQGVGHQPGAAGYRGRSPLAGLPLSLPATTEGELNGESIAEALMRYEAVRLFVDRARLRLPDFGLTRGNVGAVVRVCRRHEGIPLAIELATARMGALAVEQVAQRLEVSLDVLKGTSRTAEPRQQTLRATLDWSYKLLSETEQALFRRFSVFAGGWTLEATESVCSGGGIEQDDVLDLLGGLVDKSLVVARAATTGGAIRYRILEPVRQYARERLEESGEAQAIRRRHAAFFLILAKEAEPGLTGAQQQAWVDYLEAEHDNLRAALSWSLENESHTAIQLAALAHFWEIRSQFLEGSRWLEAALQRNGSAGATGRAKALSEAGTFAWHRGQYDQATTLHGEALNFYRE